MRKINKAAIDKEVARIKRVLSTPYIPQRDTTQQSLYKAREDRFQRNARTLARKRAIERNNTGRTSEIEDYIQGTGQYSQPDIRGLNKRKDRALIAKLRADNTKMLMNNKTKNRRTDKISVPLTRSLVKRKWPITATRGLAPSPKTIVKNVNKEDTWDYNSAKDMRTKSNGETERLSITGYDDSGEPIYAWNSIKGSTPQDVNKPNPVSLVKGYQGLLGKKGRWGTDSSVFTNTMTPQAASAQNKLYAFQKAQKNTKPGNSSITVKHLAGQKPVDTSQDQTPIMEKIFGPSAVEPIKPTTGQIAPTKGRTQYPAVSESRANKLAGDVISSGAGVLGNIYNAPSKMGDALTAPVRNIASSAVDRIISDYKKPLPKRQIGQPVVEDQIAQQMTTPETAMEMFKATTDPKVKARIQELMQEMYPEYWQQKLAVGLK